MTRQTRLLSVAFLLTAALAGCRIALPFPGGGLGHSTVVENASGDGLVIGVSEEAGTRYYPAPPDSVTVVDTVGELNPWIQQMTVYDSMCNELRVQTDGFDMGAYVRIEPDAAISLSSPYSTDGSAGPGLTSCEESALQL